MSEQEKVMLSKVSLINEHKEVIKNNILHKITYQNQSVALIYVITKMLLENKTIEEYQDIDTILSKLEHLEFLANNNVSLMEIFSTIRCFMYRCAPVENEDLEKLEHYNVVLPYLSKPKQYRKKMEC